VVPHLSRKAAGKKISKKRAAGGKRPVEDNCEKEWDGLRKFLQKALVNEDKGRKKKVEDSSATPPAIDKAERLASKGPRTPKILRAEAGGQG